MRPVTPSPQVAQLLTGHERRGPSWTWRPRGTPTPLLIHTLSGRGSVRLDESREQQVASGDTVMWLPGTAQNFGCRDADEGWEIVWCHFRPRARWRGWLDWPLSDSGVLQVIAPTERTRTRVAEALLDMDSGVRTLSPHALDFALNALERALLWLRTSTATAAETDDRIEEAVLFITRHLASPLTVAMIADAVQISPSRFSHLFKEKVGVPPARFVELRRIERAQNLLTSTSMTVRGVARSTGFSNQFYFATRFKELHGTSPSTWRQQQALTNAPWPTGPRLATGDDDHQL